MEKIILVILTALGSVGEKYAHIVFDNMEAWITKSETQIDNSIFYKAIEYIKSWTPKNPIE